MPFGVSVVPGRTVYLLADNTKSGVVEAVLIDRNNVATYVVSGDIARNCTEFEIDEARDGRRFVAETSLSGAHRVLLREQHAPGLSATWAIADRIDSRERAELIAKLLEEHAKIVATRLVTWKPDART